MELRTAVHKRPGMYFCAPQNSLGRLIAMLYMFDTLYAGVRTGQVQQIHLTLHLDQSFSIESNGPAPVEALQLDDPLGGDLWQPLGPHWQPLIVCAAASEFSVDSYADGFHHQRAFREGIPTSPWRTLEKSSHTGTRFQVQLDPTIFTGEVPSFFAIVGHLRARAACAPGLAIRLSDECSNRTIMLRYPEGLHDYLTERLASPGPRHSFPFRFTSEQVEVALWWGVLEVQHSFANGERTYEDGTHVVGLIEGVGQVLQSYEPEIAERNARPNNEDLLHNLNYAVSVWLGDVQYAGSTKLELSSAEARVLVRDLILRHLPAALEGYPGLGGQLLRSAYQNAERRRWLAEQKEAEDEDI